MYKYFNMLQNYLNRPVRKDICMITKELAESGGIYRGERKFINGKKVIQNMYSQKFDSSLVAEWLLFYKNLFIYKLSPHPELIDDQVDIINNTLSSVMSYLELKKAVEPNIINKYVNTALYSRINYSMFCKGSVQRLMEHRETGKRSVRLKGILNTVATPFSQIEDKSNWEPSHDFEYDPVLSDLANELDTEVGRILLHTMLGKKVIFQRNRVDVYLSLNREDCTEETRSQIVEAYNKIAEAVCKYSDDKVFQPIHSVKYSFEV